MTAPGERIRVAVFKPFNARHTTAFYGAQHTLFKYLQDHHGMDFTYVVDDRAVTFDGVRTAYVRKSWLGTLLAGGYKFFVSDQVPYPFYYRVGFDEFDLVIAEGIKYSLLHYVRHCGAKVILNDSLSHDPGFSPRRVRYLNKYFAQAQSVVVTERVRALYDRYRISIPVTVIGHPVDASGIAFRHHTKAPRRLVTIGRLVPEKGYEIILSAVSSLAGRYPDLTLDIFGTGPLHDRLAKMARGNGLATRIQFLGQVKREDLLRRLGDYDLLISHSVETRHAAEPFLMANLEAMAAGLPVLTSDCGGIPSVVGDRARIVRQGDVEGLVTALERFLSGVEDVGDWSARGRRYVEERYALRPIADRWSQVIRGVLGRASG